MKYFKASDNGLVHMLLCDGHFVTASRVSVKIQIIYVVLCVLNSTQPIEANMRQMEGYLSISWGLRKWAWWRRRSCCPSAP